MGIFLIPLFVAFAYELSAGALDWGPVRRRSRFAGSPVLRAGTWRGVGVEEGPPGDEGPQTGEAA
jgi:hypothetical protein